MKANWRTEHGSGYDVPSVISEEFTDISYRNDVCPSFVHAADEEAYLRLWVEHPDVSKREDTDSKRYAIQSEEWFETDDLSEALEKFREMWADILRRSGLNGHDDSCEHYGDFGAMVARPCNR